MEGGMITLTLKEARKNKKLTLEEVAEKLNLTASTISKYENGTIIPKIDQINSLLKLYEVRYEELDFLKV